MGVNKQGNTTLTILNLYHYLTVELTDQGYGFVNIFEAYPDTTEDDFVSQLPAVSIGSFGDAEGNTFELGNEQEEYNRPIMVDIFTKPRADMQTNDLKDIIKNLFKKETIFSFLDFNAATPYPVTSKLKIKGTRDTVLATAPEVYCHAIVVFKAELIE